MDSLQDCSKEAGDVFTQHYASCHRFWTNALVPDHAVLLFPENVLKQLQCWLVQGHTVQSWIRVSRRQVKESIELTAPGSPMSLRDRTSCQCCVQLMGTAERGARNVCLQLRYPLAPETLRDTSLPKASLFHFLVNERMPGQDVVSLFAKTWLTLHQDNRSTMAPDLVF